MFWGAFGGSLLRIALAGPLAENYIIEIPKCKEGVGDLSSHLVELLNGLRGRSFRENVLKMLTHCLTVQIAQAAQPRRLHDIPIPSPPQSPVALLLY